jgi:hypothetical protein
MFAYGGRACSTNNYTPGAELMGADVVTLFLNNQKNNHKGATIHHTA